MRYLLLFSFFLNSTILSAQHFTAVQQELEDLYQKADSLYTLQENLLLKGEKETHNFAQLSDQINTFDSIAVNRISKLINDFGWLGESEVGKKANRALFLIVQHTKNPEIRIMYYPQLEISVKMEESDPADLARMKDLILVEQGKKQLYGTQYKIVDGKKLLIPVENPTEVNKRRKEMGLSRLRK